MVGTWLDLTEILKSRKSSFSSRSTSSIAAATSASAWSRCATWSRCRGSEPELAPIRIGIPAFFAALTTSSTLSGPPMLPGLIRTAATPPSIAFSASDALKWMSAITGIGERRTIRGRASASAVFGTATRTTSQPAEASAAIWAVVASTSCVFVRVMDCTTTGALPPIATPPTLIWRWLAISGGSLASAQPADVVREPDEEEQDDEDDADGRDPLVYLPCNGAAADALDQREGDVPAVERQQREQVQQRERQADQSEHPQIVLDALLCSLVERLCDPDRAGDLLAALAAHEPGE